MKLTSYLRYSLPGHLAMIILETYWLHSTLAILYATGWVFNVNWLELIPYIGPFLLDGAILVVRHHEIFWTYILSPLVRAALQGWFQYFDVIYFFGLQLFLYVLVSAGRVEYYNFRHYQRVTGTYFTHDIQGRFAKFRAEGGAHPYFYWKENVTILVSGVFILYLLIERWDIFSQTTPFLIACVTMTVATKLIDWRKKQARISAVLKGNEGLFSKYSGQDGIPVHPDPGVLLSPATLEDLYGDLRTEMLPSGAKMLFSARTGNFVLYVAPTGEIITSIASEIDARIYDEQSYAYNKPASD